MVLEDELSRKLTFASSPSSSSLLPSALCASSNCSPYVAPLLLGLAMVETDRQEIVAEQDEVSGKH